MHEKEKKGKGQSARDIRRDSGWLADFSITEMVVQSSLATCFLKRCTMRRPVVTCSHSLPFGNLEERKKVIKLEKSIFPAEIKSKIKSDSNECRLSKWLIKMERGEQLFYSAFEWKMMASLVRIQAKGRLLQQ